MKIKRARVVYSYTPQNVDELELRADDVIDVLDIVEEGWWKGRLRGKIGVFPSNFVQEVNDIGSMDCGLGGNPSGSDEFEGVEGMVVDGSLSSKTAKGKLTNEENHSIDLDIIKPKQIIGIPTPIRLGSSGGGNLKAVLKPLEDKSKPPPKKPPPPTPLPSTPPDVDSPAPRLPPKPMREQAKVLFAYEAQNDDELTIKEGDIITIISKEVEDQGWWKGELSGKIGVFPDNFVELIKAPAASDDLSLPPRLKRPDRPTEKPPPISASPPVSSKPSSLTGSLAADDGNKSSSSSSVSHPCIPGKKPKAPSGPHTKQTGAKPDVVPQEVPLRDENYENHAEDTDGHFGNIEPSNKLTHLTAKRAKGPKDRRPPSMLGLPKEMENGFGKENGSTHDLKNIANALPASESNKAHQSSPPQLQQQQSQQTQSQTQQHVPWMLELKKTQEKKNEEKRKATNLDDSPGGGGGSNGSGKQQVVTPSSPTKTSPNRFSGDFSTKFGAKEPTSLPSDVNDCSPVSVNATPTPYKPAKAVKPATASLGSTKLITTPPGKPHAQQIDNASNNMNSVSNKEVIELQNELRTLKESMVPKSDYEELLKQVNELREVVESQKQSYGSLIKDLINDVADTRKKMATLQIEVDRLRRLTTTV